jgi:hypothetical protein
LETASDEIPDINHHSGATFQNRPRSAANASNSL